MTQITYNNSQSKHIIFIAGMILFGVLTFTLFVPYLNILVLAFIIVQIFYPFYELIYRRSKNKSLAVTLSVLVAFIIVLLTITLLSIFTYGEIKNYLAGTEINSFVNKIQIFINNIIGLINDFSSKTHSHVAIPTISSLSSFDWSSVINKLRDSFIPQQLLTKGVDLVYTTMTVLFNILLQIFLLIFSMIYLFLKYDKLADVFDKISPLDRGINLILYDKFVGTIKGTIKGTFLVAIIQASVMIVPLILIGVRAPILIWLLMIVVSIIPIGSGLIWGPAALLTIISGISGGNPSLILAGVLLMVYGAIAVNLIDTPLRSRLIKGDVDIHPLITIFSILGGLLVFGIFGIVYGPLIVVIFTTIIEVFKNQESNKEEEIKVIEISKKNEK